MTELQQARMLLNEGQGLQDIMLFDWLVQQAEKAAELEGENEVIKGWYTAENELRKQKEKAFLAHIAKLEDELKEAKKGIAEANI